MNTFLSIIFIQGKGRILEDLTNTTSSVERGVIGNFIRHEGVAWLEMRTFLRFALGVN